MDAKKKKGTQGLKPITHTDTCGLYIFSRSVKLEEEEKKRSNSSKHSHDNEVTGKSKTNEQNQRGSM